MKIRKIIAALSAAAIVCAAFSGCAGPATGGDVLSIQEGRTENLAGCRQSGGWGSFHRLLCAQ